jgi:hypothetical protein
MCTGKPTKSKSTHVARRTSHSNHSDESGERDVSNNHTVAPGIVSGELRYRTIEEMYLAGFPQRVSRSVASRPSSAHVNMKKSRP